VTDPLIPCVIYAAKSTEDRRGSIPEQLSESREAIDRAGGRRVEAEYVDEAFSAFRRNRGPGLVDAMQHVEDLVHEAGSAELWAQHSDRLARGDGRSARHVVEIGLWALKRDVSVRTVQDPDTFRDLLYAVVTGQRNHEDSRRKGLAMAAGRRRAAARGDFVGYRPDGYLLTVDVDAYGRVHKRMVIDPARQEPIAMIFRLAQRGRSTGAIATSLNRAGWRTNPRRRGAAAKPWRPTQVGAVLRNPRYAGLAMFGGEIVARGHWPAYVTERQHQNIRARRAGRPLAKKPQRLDTYLLSGLVRCGRCGEPLHCPTGRSRRDGSLTRRYICASHEHGRGVTRCPAKRMSADMLEAMFVASLRALLDAGGDEQLGVVGSQPTTIFDVSRERQELRESLTADGEMAFGVALQRLLVRLGPQMALARESDASPKMSRRFDAVERFEIWAEQESQGRNDASRAEASKLNRLLRRWFSGVTVIMDEVHVGITARHHTTGDGDGSERSRTVQLNRVDWTRVACHNGQPRLRYGGWDDSEIVGALQAWADANGRSPIRTDWLKAEGNYPTSLTVVSHFKSWRRALRVAGLAPYVPPSHPRNTPWGDAEILQALRDWTAQQGRVPIWHDWRRAVEGRPCNQTVCDHFGNWRAGLAAAGLL
jgi:DNA invertase Pin-like site-specific DNA recombinase